MTPQNVLEQLLALGDRAAQRPFLIEQAARLDEAGQAALAAGLKDKAEQFLRADIQRARQTAALLLDMAGVTGNPRHRALGLLAEANLWAIGLGEFRQAIERYDEAAQLYAAAGCQVEQATAQIGKIAAMSSLGEHEAALQTGRWAAQILEQQQAWFPLAKLTSNLAAIHIRLGQDAQALTLLEQAQSLYERAGLAASPGWARAEFNRAVTLRNLGHFELSVQASQQAIELLEQLHQPVEAARARQSLAITDYVLGRYNEALSLLDEVREVFLADGRRRDAILTELFISDCLLQLRRFADVLEKCQQVRQLFTELGTRFEVAQAILNEAIAYAGDGQFTAALDSLTEARGLFEANGNQTWMATADLEMAAVLLRGGEATGREGSEVEAMPSPGATPLQLAEQAMAVFQAYGQPVAEAQARLVAAQAAATLANPARARELLAETLAFAESHNVPFLTFQSYSLLGRLARGQGDRPAALEAYDRSIQELERLRGRLMVEFRAGFLEDKQGVYEDAVGLCLDMGQTGPGLEYAERAKSRALLELLAFRLELGVEARAAEDAPLVAELTRLRDERDRLYRRWESGDGGGERGVQAPPTDQQQAQQEVLALEKRITDLWHKLLIRNAGYARDAALWQVRAEPVQPYLTRDTLLLEYFVAHDELIIFMVTADTVEARRLPNPLPAVQELRQKLWVNLRRVARSQPAQVAAYTANAQGLLRRLHELLLSPIRDILAGYHRLIVVPHGPLHYLPFHALYDGRRYLLETHEVSYLPGASFLRYCQPLQGNSQAEKVRPFNRENPRQPVLSASSASPSSRPGLLAMGHSSAGRLPYTVQEAQVVAELWGGRTLLEGEATRAALRESGAACRAIHLATHGDFRPDNPLFSGLVLADGWLTTLDIFSLRLPVSLVTLSACQTGQHVVGGGDELLGLMRAFLSAGAASLALTLWAVEDRSTARLMERFYGRLAAGWTKGAALRDAQCQFLAGKETAAYAHPYFWAPFFLVGDAGPLV
ncbi:MAG: CHAT domain-containing tetratricopeptide repeat protein [Chloroflexota bacterium]